MTQKKRYSRRELADKADYARKHATAAMANMDAEEKKRFARQHGDKAAIALADGDLYAYNFHQSYADTLLGLDAHEFDVVHVPQRSRSRMDQKDNVDKTRGQKITDWKEFFTRLFSGVFTMNFRGKDDGDSEEGGKRAMPGGSGFWILVGGVVGFAAAQALIHVPEISLVVAGLLMREAYTRTNTPKTYKQVSAVFWGVLPTVVTIGAAKWPFVVAIIVHLWLWNSLPLVTHVEVRKPGNGGNGGDEKEDDEIKNDL